MKEKYTKIPNEILEALAKTKLCNYENRYILALLRKTYGWNKPSDYIANSQFVRATNIKKQHIWRTEQRLLWRGIVTKRGNKISLNTSYEQWKELPKGVTVPQSGIKVTQKSTEVTQNGGDKEHLTKEIIQKKDASFLKNKAEAYKKGERNFKPYFRGEEMRWKEGEKKWYVISYKTNNKGDWLEFAGKESEIEWK